MKPALFFSLLAAGLFLILIDQPFLAALFAIGAGLVLAKAAIWGTGHAAKSLAKGATAGIKEDVSKSETSSPGLEVVEEAAKNAADLAGHQLYAGQQKDKKPYLGDQYQFKFKGISSLAKANDRLIEFFKKVFK